MPGKLRRVSVTAADGGYVLSDPYGLTDQVIWLGRPAMAIASLLNHQASLEAWQEDVERAMRAKVPLDQLETLVQALDNAGFLDTDEMRERLASAERAYLNAGVRPMALAGRCFPGEPDRFERFVAELRAAAGGPVAGPLSGLVLPHLEITSVPGVYGAALEGLAATPVPERVLLVGVAHQPIRELAAGLPLDLETPLGRLPVDRQALDLLADVLPFDLYATPLAFRQEHSIEFPAALLHAVWRRGFKVVPLIVGGLDDAESLEPLIAAIDHMQGAFPSFAVASVDLSHVGARFGDPVLDDEVAVAVEDLDRGYLKALAGGHFQRAFDSVTGTGNPTRIDAYASVHAIHRHLPGKGEVLGYQLAREPQTGSAVGAGVVAFR